MLRSARIQNFKALGPEAVSVEFAPLTVFVGENGAGKSSILDAIAILGQSVRERHNRSGLVIEGELTELVGDYSKEARRRLFYRHDTSNWLAIAVEVALDLPPLSQRVEFFGDRPERMKRWPPRSVTFEVRTRENREVSEWTQELRLDGLVLAHWATLLGANPRFGPTSSAEFLGIASTRGGSSDRILNHDLFHAIDTSKLTPEQLRLLEVARTSGDIFARHFIENLSFLSSVRGAPLFQNKTGRVTETVGKHGEESLRLLNSLTRKGREKVQWLEDAAARFGLRALRGAWTGGDELSAVYVDPHSGTEIDSLTFAGSGSKLVVPVLLALARAEAGETILLDEPEISLHPAWILELAKVLVDASQRGVQILLTTQAPTLVMAIARAAREQPMRDLLSVVEMRRNEQGAFAEVLPFSPSGFLTKWPYADVEARLLTEALSAPETRPGPKPTKAPIGRKGSTRRKRSTRHG